jgi:hypothetical protein
MNFNTLTRRRRRAAFLALLAMLGLISCGRDREAARQDGLLPAVPGAAPRGFFRTLHGDSVPVTALLFYIDSSGSSLDKAEFGPRAKLSGGTFYNFALQAAPGSEAELFATATPGRPARLLYFRVPRRASERKQAALALRRQVEEAVLKAYSVPASSSPLLEDAAYLAERAGGKGGSLYLMWDYWQYTRLLRAAEILSASSPIAEERLRERTLRVLPPLPPDRIPRQIVTIYVPPVVGDEPLPSGYRRRLEPFILGILRAWGAKRVLSREL